MFDLPEETIVNRFIAKSKFYNNTTISTKIKDDFVNKIEKITWLYKLSPNNINIDRTETTEEIEIFEIILRDKIVPIGVLRTIAKAIPYKILFVLKFDNDICFAIKVDDIIYSDWNEQIKFELKGLNLENVYQNIVKKIIKEENSNKAFNVIIDEKNKKDELEKQINLLEQKIKLEKQFDRKVELNKKLNKIKSELEVILYEQIRNDK